MITAEGRSYVRVRLDGFLFPNTVRLILIRVHSHRIWGLPMLLLRVVDTNNELKNRIYDRARIEVLVSQRKENDAEWIPFRVFSQVPDDTSNQGTLWTINGYYDYPNYLFDNVSRIFQGSSSSVIETLAQEGGLTPIVDTTTENRTWYCPSMTLAKFIKTNVVPMGKASENSFMQSVIDARTRSWYYRDLNSIIANEEPLAAFTNTTAVDRGEYNGFFSEHTYVNMSGYTNQLAYSMKNARYDVTTGEFTQDVPIQVVKTDKLLSVNAEGAPDRSYVLHSPMDFGNDEDGWEQRAKNFRQASMFPIELEILTPTFTKFPLFSMHKIDMYSGQTGRNERKSGRYLVIGRSFAATTSDYRERLSFIRNSENLQSDQLL